MRKEFLVLASLMVCVAMVGMVSAGGCTGGDACSVASVTVPGILSVTAGDINFSPTAAGGTANAPLNIAIPASNVQVNIQALATSSTFSCSGSSGCKIAPTLLETALTWSDGAGSPTWSAYSTVSSSPSLLTECQNMGPNAGCQVPNKIILPGTQTAGTYSLNITLTAVQSP
jgi:hypothetical protein